MQSSGSEAVCLAFMWEGTGQHNLPEGFYDSWGGGGAIEFAQKLRPYAGLAAALSDACAEDRYSFPGVFEYDVCEEFGAWYRGHMVEQPGEVPCRDDSMYHLANTTYRFFEQHLAEAKQLPEGALDFQLAAVIWEVVADWASSHLKV